MLVFSSDSDRAIRSDSRNSTLSDCSTITLLSDSTNSEDESIDCYSMTSNDSDSSDDEQESTYSCSIPKIDESFTEVNQLEKSTVIPKKSNSQEKQPNTFYPVHMNAAVMSNRQSDKLVLRHCTFLVKTGEQCGTPVFTNENFCIDHSIIFKSNCNQRTQLKIDESSQNKTSDNPNKVTFQSILNTPNKADPTAPLSKETIQPVPGYNCIKQSRNGDETFCNESVNPGKMFCPSHSPKENLSLKSVNVPSFCYKCALPLTDYDYCSPCDSIFCKDCWFDVHNFYPLNIHPKLKHIHTCCMDLVCTDKDKECDGQVYCLDCSPPGHTYSKVDPRSLQSKVIDHISYMTPLLTMLKLDPLYDSKLDDLLLFQLTVYANHASPTVLQGTELLRRFNTFTSQSFTCLHQRFLK